MNKAAMLILFFDRFAKLWLKNLFVNASTSTNYEYVKIESSG